MLWSINSWQKFKTKHMPKYNENIISIKKELSQKESIVDAKGINELISLLSNNTYNNFIVQMGECAESFADSNKENILQRINLIEEFCKILPSNFTPIKIGRIAGQYSKPRSEDFEIINNEKVPVYKGDMFHDYNYREIQANRIILAYENAKKSYEIIKNNNKNIFISHEALNLHYEEALTRLNEDGKYYNTSAHMLWLGEKTRFIGSAHVEYLRGISNPIGIKISNAISSKDLIEIINTLNPNNIKGKIILINRMGVKNTINYLEEMVKEINDSNLNVTWICDPMHGNTYKTENNYKTRNLKDITTEIENFANTLLKNGVPFSGIHLESTPQDVYECLDDSYNKIGEKYKTLCDPRLNTNQSFEVAKLITKLIG